MPQLIVTPDDAGRAPPPLGAPLPETEEVRAARRAARSGPVPEASAQASEQARA